MSYAGTELVNYLSQVTRDQLGFTDVATYNAFIAGTLIPQAENFIDNYCGGRVGTLRRFNYNAGSLDLDGNGKEALLLPPQYAPWLVLTSLTVNSGANIASSIKIHSQYLHYYGGAFTDGARNVTAIGTYGYAPVPPAINYVCGQLCANMLLDMKRRRGASPDASVGGASLGGMMASPLFSAPWIFTEDMKGTLNEYRFSWIGLG